MDLDRIRILKSKIRTSPRRGVKFLEQERIEVKIFWVEVEMACRMGRQVTRQRAVNRSFYWPANGPVLSLFITGPLTLLEIPLSLINVIKGS